MYRLVQGSPGWSLIGCPCLAFTCLGTLPGVPESSGRGRHLVHRRQLRQLPVRGQFFALDHIHGVPEPTDCQLLPVLQHLLQLPPHGQHKPRGGGPHNAERQMPECGMAVRGDPLRHECAQSTENFVHLGPVVLQTIRPMGPLALALHTSPPIASDVHEFIWGNKRHGMGDHSCKSTSEERTSGP